MSHRTFKAISKRAWQHCHQAEVNLLALTGCEWQQQLYYYNQASHELTLQLADAGQPLMQEWQLRRWLFNLVRWAIAAQCHWQRQTLLDQLYQPLLALQALYRQSPQGAERFSKLQRDLRRLLQPLYQRDSTGPAGPRNRT
ncbi:hypothetical protein KJY73_17790 [Bowmanella sp. Y26]|uniref:hypothetical protein n=1 Tax=Bowmanella yangjiangensis TaxID=2811230 RepID=UPI001BDCF1F1|nr:hypothetical protein [Bowmanella yangjiangensis]MBT1065444.1 hypothetical protein [Bowmanella yangjiangensis]